MLGDMSPLCLFAHRVSHDLHCIQVLGNLKKPLAFSIKSKHIAFVLMTTDDDVYEIDHELNLEGKILNAVQNHQVS